MERLRKLNRKLKNSLLFEYNSVIICSVYGVWRSLVARTAGGREVAGSNPVAPIVKIAYLLAIFFVGLPFRVA